MQPISIPQTPLLFALRSLSFAATARERRRFPQRACLGWCFAVTFPPMPKLSVRDLEVAGKRVLLRVDFNVPTEEKDGHVRITDDTRIRESLPTIEYLRQNGAKVI